ncbi:hypothetical protein AAW14_36255 [Streptomyces hygroscopicus]|nr:hypothetical protein [Streptomyces hygroscopicus]
MRWRVGDLLVAFKQRRMHTVQRQQSSRALGSVDSLYHSSGAQVHYRSDTGSCLGTWEGSGFLCLQVLQSTFMRNLVQEFADWPTVHLGDEAVFCALEAAFRQVAEELLAGPGGR